MSADAEVVVGEDVTELEPEVGIGVGCLGHLGERLAEAETPVASEAALKKKAC